MTEQLGDFAQWAADTERLLIAGLSNGGGYKSPIDYDEETVEAVQQRCISRLGSEVGVDYFRTLLTTLPARRPELFPEFAGLE